MSISGTGSKELDESLNKLKEGEKFIKEQFSNQINSESSDSDFLYNKLLSITYNNFACIYKKLNKPELSLEFLKSALQAED